MTDTPAAIPLRFVGPDVGVARLKADLEAVGAYNVVVEPDPNGDDRVDSRCYTGTITGLTVEQAMQAALAYLATAEHNRVWVDDHEVVL